MQEPLKIAVCEDTSADRSRLVQILQTAAIPTQCTVFADGEALLEAFRPQAFDLLLADIFLGEGKMTGIETVSRLRDLGSDIPVAFITTSTDYTLESYRLSALKYIEKPFKPEDLNDILTLALLKKNSAPALVVQKNGRDERIPFSQIVYLEQQKHRLHIHQTDGTVLQVYERLTPLLSLLPPQDFFCPHKSFAANLAHVCSIDAELKCFVMDDGDNVPIRRESMGQAKKALENYLFGWTRRLSQ